MRIGEIEDARRVFAEAKALAKIKPAFVVTDGLRAYQDAFNKEFFHAPQSKNRAR